MTTEQDKTLEALQIAIQMEIDGKEFYLKASRESSNELGKKLLQALAGEEDERSYVSALAQFTEQRKPVRTI